jgi:hypothetical protein
VTSKKLFFFGDHDVAKECQKRLVVQNKKSLLVKVFWKLVEHHNDLHFSQITNSVQKILQIPNNAWLGLGLTRAPRYSA